jgi:hypothetical protein
MLPSDAWRSGFVCLCVPGGRFVSSGQIVPQAAPPASRSARRRQLDRLRAQVSAAFQAAGFVFDKTAAWARDEGQYAVWLLPYGATSGAGEGLRPTIKVELNYAPLRRATVTLPVRSFVAEALDQPAEVPAVACCSEPHQKNVAPGTGRADRNLQGQREDQAVSRRPPCGARHTFFEIGTGFSGVQRPLTV